MYHFKLPLGYTDTGGTLHREVELLPLSGKEEELLAHFAGNDPTGLLNLVLERSLKCVGNFSPVSRDMIKTFSKQDRLFLLWQLQQNTFGDRVQDTVSCTGPACGKPVDIDFSIQGLIRGILANGEEFDGQPELEVHCPECALVFPFLFDIAAFLLKRVQVGLGLLYHEVHVLAYHYHWSENEILSMPREKRKMYLRLLAAERQQAVDDEGVIVPPAESGPRGEPWAESIKFLETIQAQSGPQETGPLSPRSFNDSLGLEFMEPAGTFEPAEPAAGTQMPEKLPLEIAGNDHTLLPAPGYKEKGKNGVAVVEICLPGRVERVEHVERENHKPLPGTTGPGTVPSYQAKKAETASRYEPPALPDMPVTMVKPSPVMPDTPDTPDMLDTQVMPVTRITPVTAVKPSPVMPTKPPVKTFMPLTPVTTAAPVNSAKPVTQTTQTTQTMQTMQTKPVTPPVISTTPVYLSSPARGVSAFWERTFMGRFHLKFLR